MVRYLRYLCSQYPVGMVPVANLTPKTIRYKFALTLIYHPKRWLTVFRKIRIRPTQKKFRVRVHSTDLQVIWAGMCEACSRWRCLTSPCCGTGPPSWTTRPASRTSPSRSWRRGPRWRRPVGSGSFKSKVLISTQQMEEIFNISRKVRVVWPD